MTMWHFLKVLIVIGLTLFVRVRGLVWLVGAGLLLSGLASSIRCAVRGGGIVTTAAWSLLLAAGLFVLGLFLPNIRMLELLYR